MSNENLPVKSGDDFFAIAEKMDLSDLRGKTYAVAVATGAPGKGKFLSTTIHGPYQFAEMVEEVGRMWAEHQHHAQVYILEKDRKKHPEFLDNNTIEYIEAHWEDIVVEEVLEAAISDSEYTCRAGILSTKEEVNVNVEPEQT